MCNLSGQNTEKRALSLRMFLIHEIRQVDGIKQEKEFLTEKSPGILSFMWTKIPRD